MKKILGALIIAGFACGGAQAQKMQVCGTKSDKVCRLTTNKRVSCYKTKYAENFKVCMGEYGYYICCERPNRYNSTEYNSGVVRRTARAAQQPEVAALMPMRPEVAVPQSQSYVVTSSNVYEGYYPQRGRIKVCYTGDNVAAENRNPYEGCPSPAYDGPDANIHRNVNVSNPEPMPPSSGVPY